MAVLSRSDLGILSFLANSDFVAISREYLYANHLGDVSQMVRDEVVRIKEDGVAVMVNKCTWLLLEKIIDPKNDFPCAESDKACIFCNFKQLCAKGRNTF